MSAEIREAIAAAASTVEGVNVSPWYRQSVKAGDGCVRYDRTNYPDPFGGLVTWQVVITLPSDLAAAEKWIAAHGSDLRTAVSEELMVRSMTAVQLAIDSGTVPSIVIEGQRAEE